MPSTHKATVLFDVPGAGWSESYYLEAEGPREVCEVMLQGWASQRRALMPKTEGNVCKIIGIRAQKVVNPVDSFAVVTDLSGTYECVNDLLGIDMPWTGVLLRITGQNGSKRMFTMRGVPDEVVEGSYRSPIIRNGWTKALNDWITTCARRGFEIQSIRETLNPLRPISSMVWAGGLLTVTAAAAHLLTEGDYVSFNQVKANVPIQGRHRVIVSSPTIFSVRGFNVGSLGFLSGFFRHVIFDYEAWASVQYVRKAERKAGRPFFLLRGRR